MSRLDPELFISHIALEAKLACVLKEQIETAFEQKSHVFVSSSPDDISTGKQWLKQISDALNTSKALLILCSKTSIYSPWLFLEAGFAMSRGLTLLPICHGGQEKDNLPLPLALSQCLELSGSGFSQRLISDLSNILQLRPTPSINHKKNDGQALKMAKDASFKLSALRAIEGRHWATCTAIDLGSTLGTTEVVMRKHLRFLCSGGYLRTTKNVQKKVCYLLIPKGRRLLQLGYN